MLLTVAWDLVSANPTWGYYGSGSSGTLGMQFSVAQTTPIGAIGAYDFGANGFTGGSIPVGVWTAGGSMVYSTTIASGSPQIGDFGGSYRYASTPGFTLAPGQYVTGAYYQSGDLGQTAPGNATVTVDVPGFSTSQNTRATFGAFTFPGPTDLASPGLYSVNFISGPPELAGNTNIVFVNEGQTVLRSGSFGAAGESFTLSSNFGSVSFSYANTVIGTGNWNWSYAASDGPLNGTVIVTARGNTTGRTETFAFPLSVGNVPPTATGLIGPVSLSEGQTATYSLAGVTDPSGIDAATLRYSFALSDAALATNYGDAGPANSFATSFPDNGTFTVWARVFDKDGGANTYVTSVTVNNVAPVVNAGADQTVYEGESVTFSGTFSDPGSADAHTIEWDFGDGSPIVSGTLNPTHSYPDSGSYTVTLRVTDDDGDASVDTLTVTVHVAPTVTVIASDSDAGESSSDGEFTVSLTAPSFTPTVVNFAVTGSATHGVDYETIGSSVIIPAGETSAKIPVDVRDDSDLEGSEAVGGYAYRYR